jgi:predicted transcriptional regulator
MSLPEQAELRFDGKTYEAKLDQNRLGRQMKQVFALMSDGQWRTLAEIEAATWEPQASISARLRDLRKPRWGSYTVNRRRRGDGRRGLFEYQVPQP